MKLSLLVFGIVICLAEVQGSTAVDEAKCLTSLHRWLKKNEDGENGWMQRDAKILGVLRAALETRSEQRSDKEREIIQKLCQTHMRVRRNIDNNNNSSGSSTSITLAQIQPTATGVLIEQQTPIISSSYVLLSVPALSSSLTTTSIQIQPTTALMETKTTSTSVTSSSSLNTGENPLSTSGVIMSNVIQAVSSISPMLSVTSTPAVSMVGANQTHVSASSSVISQMMSSSVSSPSSSVKPSAREMTPISSLSQGMKTTSLSGSTIMPSFSKGLPNHNLTATNSPNIFTVTPTSTTMKIEKSKGNTSTIGLTSSQLLTSTVKTKITKSLNIFTVTPTSTSLHQFSSLQIRTNQSISQTTTSSSNVPSINIIESQTFTIISITATPADTKTMAFSSIGINSTSQSETSTNIEINPASSPPKIIPSTASVITITSSSVNIVSNKTIYTYKVEVRLEGNCTVLQSNTEILDELIDALKKFLKLIFGDIAEITVDRNYKCGSVIFNYTVKAQGMDENEFRRKANLTVNNAHEINTTNHTFTMKDNIKIELVDKPTPSPTTTVKPSKAKNLTALYAIVFSVVGLVLIIILVVIYIGCRRDSNQSFRLSSKADYELGNFEALSKNTKVSNMYGDGPVCQDATDNDEEDEDGETILDKKEPKRDWEIPTIGIQDEKKEEVLPLNGIENKALEKDDDEHGNE